MEQVCFASRTQMSFSLLTDKIITAEQLFIIPHFPCHGEIPYNRPKTYTFLFLAFLIGPYLDKILIFQMTLSLKLSLSNLKYIPLPPHHHPSSQQEEFVPWESMSIYPWTLHPSPSITQTGPIAQTGNWKLCSSLYEHWGESRVIPTCSLLHSHI